MLDVDPTKNFDEATGALPEKPKDEKKQIAVPASGGRLVGTTLDEEFRLATAYFQSGLMPSGLNTPQKVLVALQLCRELELPPMTSIGKIMVVNGTPSIFGDLPLALVLKSDKLEEIREHHDFDEKGEAVSATCTVKRKGHEAITRKFSVSDARKANLFKNSIWDKYTKRMLQCRARAWALKDACADVLGGISIGEWDHNAMVVNGRLVGAEEEKVDAADEINREYLNEAKDSRPELTGPGPV